MSQQFRQLIELDAIRAFDEDVATLGLKLSDSGLYLVDIGEDAEVGEAI